MARRDDDHQNDSAQAQAERAEAADRVREQERARRDGHIARFNLTAGEVSHV